MLQTPLIRYSEISSNRSERAHHTSVQNPILFGRLTFQHPYEQENSFHFSGLQDIHYHLHTFTTTFIFRYYKKKQKKIFSLFLPQIFLEGSNARSTEHRLLHLMKPISTLLDPPSTFYTDRQTKLTKGSKTCAVTYSSKCMSPPTKCLPVDETPLMD